MSFEKLKLSLKSYKRLLESDTLGSYDFFTSTICLDSINSNTFKTYQSGDQATSIKLLPLAIHEYTHFVDSTSTLWGMKHLQKMNEAYSSNDKKGGRENDFFKAKDFLEHVRSLRLPNYYTLIESKTKSIRPWQYKMTMGKQFDLRGEISEKPILFSHFINSTGDFLARSPISTVSILEASAMSNEMVAKMSLINALNHKDKLVEMKIYERESLDYLYDHHLTEYSVCVHVLANTLGCKDIFIAFQICSIICRIVLNIPDTLLERVIKLSNVSEILEIPKGHEFEERIYEGIKYGNLGILYFLICRALPKNAHESKSEILVGLEFALDKIGLSFELINDETQKQIDTIYSSLKQSQINSIKLLAEAGLDNFMKIDLKNANIDFLNLSLPSVYLGDGTEATIFKNDNSCLKDIKLEEIFDELYAGEEWVTRFSEACTA